MELLEAGEVPMGILNPVEPILLSKKLWDDNRIIMVSDGVLDALPGEDKELSLLEFIAGMPIKIHRTWPTASSSSPARSTST